MPGTPGRRISTDPAEIEMACPACLCKETYEYDDGEDYPDLEDLMRCAACGAVFPLEDEAPEEDNDQRSGD